MAGNYPRGGAAIAIDGSVLQKFRAGRPLATKPKGPADHKEAVMEERVSMEEIEAEDAVSLPNKEVLSLLDVNANVDLGLDLAAPVDLAAAANLNVAAPIEAAATANVLSDGAEAVGYAEQHGTIDQGISGTADAVAPQHATVDQTSGGGTPSETGTPASGAG